MPSSVPPFGAVMSVWKSVVVTGVAVLPDAPASIGTLPLRYGKTVLPASVSVATGRFAGVAVSGTVSAPVAVSPWVGVGNVSSLIWRIPKVCSNLASVAHSASLNADGKLTVPSGLVSVWGRSPELRMTAL
jgi:hypothetical protein